MCPEIEALMSPVQNFKCAKTHPKSMLLQENWN